MTTGLKAAFGGLLGLALLFIAGGDHAQAQCCAPPVPPPCCAPPVPPTPPSNPCCSPPGHSINVPGVNVNVNASVIVNANVNAQVNAGASGASRTIVYGGGGGFGGGLAPNPVTVTGALNVEGGKEMRRIAYQDTRTKTTRVVIQAFCLDDKSVPHPASQLFPEQDVEDAFEGEIFRCIAGTRMQYSYAEYLGQANFDNASTITCAKSDSLWHAPGGKLECKPQTPARDCNERSLLRRFGAGVKVLTMTIVETYTAYREEEVETSSSSSSSMSFSGGVGGYAY